MSTITQKYTTMDSFMMKILKFYHISNQVERFSHLIMYMIVEEEYKDN